MSPKHLVIVLSHSFEKLGLRCWCHLMVVLHGPIWSLVLSPGFLWETELQMLVWSETSQWLRGWAANAGHIFGSLSGVWQRMPVPPMSSLLWSWITDGSLVFESWILNIASTFAQVLPYVLLRPQSLCSLEDIGSDPVLIFLNTEWFWFRVRSLTSRI